MNSTRNETIFQALLEVLGWDLEAIAKYDHNELIVRDTVKHAQQLLTKIRGINNEQTSTERN